MIIENIIIISIILHELGLDRPGSGSTKDLEYAFGHSQPSTFTLYRSILIIKPTRCTNFSNLFWNRTLHVSDSFSVHHQESSTVHTAIGVCHKGFADCLLAGSGWNILMPLASSQYNLYAIYLLLCIQY
jgi:hypothetical protein